MKLSEQVRRIAINTMLGLVSFTALSAVVAVMIYFGWISLYLLIAAMLLVICHEVGRLIQEELL